MSDDEVGARVEDGLAAPLECFNKLTGLNEINDVVWVNKTEFKEVNVTLADRRLIFSVYKEDFLRYGYEL